MRTDSDSRDSDSRRDDVETERRAVEENRRAVMRDIQLVPAGTTKASRLRTEQQWLADEAGRIERSGAEVPHAVASIEREMERRRIALQILAVVVPWRDALRELNVAECDLFRVRGHALLNYLDVAVMPYPDLQDELAAARSELASERPSAGSQHFH